MSLVRRIYWKFIALIARISRSVDAVNEGFTPAGSVSTGPHQPLSALRDAVALLGSTAGRLDARLESIALSSGTTVDRAVYALAFTEALRAPEGTAVWATGDAVALRLAADLAELGYDVTVGDTADTASLPLDSSIARSALADAAPADGDLVLVAIGASLAVESTAAIVALLARAPGAVLVSCSAHESSAPGASDHAWLGRSDGIRTEARELRVVERFVVARPLRSVLLSTQLAS